MSFQEQVARGSAVGALRTGAVYGALWAIGSSWSNAIREIARILFPEEDMDAIFAEIIATGLVTLMGIGIALLAAQDWCSCNVEGRGWSRWWPFKKSRTESHPPPPTPTLPPPPPRRPTAWQRRDGRI